MTPQRKLESDTGSHTSSAHPPISPLISAKQLANLVLDEGVVLLDVRWSLAGSDVAGYRAGHIPGAIFVDLDSELTDPPGVGGRHPLPTESVINGLLQRVGIHPDSSVVVYGERDTSVAARAWWLLRWAGIENVQVLNGGFAAWAASGLDVGTTENSGPANGTAIAKTGQLPIVDADTVARVASDAASVLVDVRAAERYFGQVEPVDPKPGHIPGAINLPLRDIHQKNGRLLPPADLVAALDAVGATPDAHVAVSCGSGVNACALVLAGAFVGRSFALYPGSYSGWCALDRDVVVGE